MKAFEIEKHRSLL